MSWYAVHTKPNCEQQVAFHLHKQGFEFYFPRYEKKVRHARQEKTVLRPLFPRYMFVYIDPEKGGWSHVNGTFGVVGLVSFGQTPQPVSDDVIDLFRKNENANGVIELRQNQFNVGDRVRITSGPLVECEGILQEVKDQDRVMLLLDFMGRRVRVKASLDHMVSVN